MQDPSTIMASTTLLKAISFPHSNALELACKIYSPRTLKAVAIENPNDADQAAEIVLSELHRDLILPLPWKRKGLGGIYERDVVFATAIEDFGSDHNDFHFAALGDKHYILSFSTTTKDLSFNTKLNCEPLI
ncbi:uncharacterized protein LOC130942057 isoform X1 [Arachis stenosperma]|uniref:uncharacterized protein LOC130942057 isoform X1 n=1 Tax=Arachis stenosperma TaxID=217475 RepID=UPI0025ABBB32|nr:uncharacterized protein LOC130942057 isoform X1 [Arachis stenosperma]